MASDAILRGHTLASIVSEARVGAQWARFPALPFPHVVGTKGRARLAVRTQGNVWGLSVSDVPTEGFEAWEAMRGYVD